MRKEELQQYRDLNREIAYLKKKLSELESEVVTDRVTASNREYPYQKISVEITGFPHSGYLRALQQATQSRLERCIILRQDIEKFISGIEDSRTRMVFERRYINGWSWVKISRSLGSNDESYARKIHDRYLNIKNNL